MRIQRQEEEIQQRNNSNVNISTTSAINVQEQAPPPYDGSKESVMNFCGTYFWMYVDKMNNSLSGK